MSLIESNVKNNKLVLLGTAHETIVNGKTKTVNKKYLYFDTDVPKGKRIREIRTNIPITAVPYLDLKHNGRSASYISGISGSGKSTLAANLITQLRKMRKDDDTEDGERRVVIFTTAALDNVDPAFENMKHKAIIPFDHPDFFQVQLQHLENWIVVFDDYECVKDKKVAAYVLVFMKDLLERSRKLNIDIIIINHMSQNYHKTRNIIFEADTYYLNIGMNRNSSKKFLQSYMEFDKKQLDSILNYECESVFSWTVFRKSAPSYYIQDNIIRLL